MNFSSPDMIFFAEHHFFEINYQHKCVEPTKKCLFFNFDALPWPAWAAQPAGIANFFYMHMDMLIDHSGNKISLGGWPSLGVFLCHCMLNSFFSKTVAFTKFLSKKCESISENVYKHFFVKLPFYFLISFLKNQSFIFMTLYVQKNRHAGDDTFSKTNFALAIWLLCYRSTVSVRHWKYFFFQVVFGLVNNYETNKFLFYVLTT